MGNNCLSVKSAKLSEAVQPNVICGIYLFVNALNKVISYKKL